MVPQTLENKVETLEQTMGALEELPARVATLESHIVQFREDVRVEFSAVRGEIREMGSQLRVEMRTGEERLRALNQDTVTLMRVLHEDVIGRIKMIGEK